MAEIISQIHRNKEFMLWVKQEFDNEPQQKAAIAAFSWLKTRYPEIVPVVRGELISEMRQEA